MRWGVEMQRRNKSRVRKMKNWGNGDWGMIG